MSGAIEHIDLESFTKKATALRRPFHTNYHAMYSSVYGGIVTDPALMLVPVDDHMVHRGDGVFETVKCVNGALYNMAAHLARLKHSADSVGLALPDTRDGIARIVVATVRAGGNRDCLVRICASRGPGSLAVNPYDCPRSQLYVVIYRAVQPFMESHPRGAAVRRSFIPAKLPFFAGVKSCNYLPNVLMKKEAVDAGVDFVAAFGAQGFLAEGAGENMGIVSAEGALLFPKLDGILAGTTMLRLAQLAEDLIARGELARVALENIALDDIRRCREFLVVSTTVNVAAATEFDGVAVGDGKPGPVYRRLSELLASDMQSNKEMLTPAFE